MGFSALLLIFAVGYALKHILAAPAGEEANAFGNRSSKSRWGLNFIGLIVLGFFGTILFFILALAAG